MIGTSRNGAGPKWPAVLYVVHRVPYPPDKGDRIRAFHLLKYLAGHSKVALACLADEPVSQEVVDELRRYCHRLAIVPLSKLTRWPRAAIGLLGGQTMSEGAFHSTILERTIRTWAGEEHFHVALASASSMVPYLRIPALQHVPAVVDLVDVDSQKWFDYAAITHTPMRWLYQLEGRRLRQLEQQLPTWARAMTLVSEAEADIYRRFCPDGPIHAITNGVDLDYFHPVTLPEEPTCVFTGALDYLPNVEGVSWFCRHVWPEVKRQRPQAKLHLVGRQPKPAVLRLAESPGVEVVGQVPDVRPHIARAAVAIAPLQVARGIQNKVLEALAMGKSAVVSPEALAGLHAKPGVDLLSAHSPLEWIAAILRLIDNPDLRQQLGQAGRGYVENHHTWESCLEPFGPLLRLTEASPRSESCR